MRNYPSYSSSEVRIGYGIALIRGLQNFAETRSLAKQLQKHNDELADAFQRREQLHRPWLEARQDVRFCDYNADEALRVFKAKLGVADGGRRGALSQAIFPDGVMAVVGPSGAAQLPVLTALIERVKNARQSGIDPVRDEELPKLEAAEDALKKAVAAYQVARDAYHAAFAKEQALRDEHRLAVTAIMGTVQSLFPADKRRQDVIFPEPSVASPKSSGGSEDGSEDGSAEAQPATA